MTEFKQIIGRGTRVREDYGKLYFNILDYTGSATRLFADPDFDGEPALITEMFVDEAGKIIPGSERIVQEEVNVAEQPGGIAEPHISHESPRQKYYFDGGNVEIAAHLVYELDTEGKQLRVVQLTDYTADKVRTLYRSPEDLRTVWADPEQRAELLGKLEERGVDMHRLAEVVRQPDADPFDLLCHVAFNAPVLTRRARAERLKREEKAFFDQYGPEARAVLEDLLDKYSDHGIAQFTIPDALKIPPISDRGNVAEIIRFFGGAEKLKKAVDQLQARLYAN